MEIPDGMQQLLLDVARTGIREELTGARQYTVPETSDPILSMPAGCFVTLHDAASHRPRGCIGRLQCTDPLIQTVLEVARSVVHDPRFVHVPVRPMELPRLELEISVLSPLSPAENPLDFDPPNDGIYLMCNGRAGTFLPQVARETGWTREQLLTRLCTEKMGLSASAWKQADAKLLKYQAVVIGPVPFVKKEEAAATPPPAQATTAADDVPLAYPPVLGDRNAARW